VVPKVWVNYLLGVIYDSSGGKKVIRDKSILVAFFLRRKILRVIRQSLP